MKQEKTEVTTELNDYAISLSPKFFEFNVYEIAAISGIINGFATKKPVHNSYLAVIEHIRKFGTGWKPETTKKAVIVEKKESKRTIKLVPVTENEHYVAIKSGSDKNEFIIVDGNNNVRITPNINKATIFESYSDFKNYKLSGYYLLFRID